MLTWLEHSIEQKARVCERIHRRLSNYGPESATGLMHGCALTLDCVGGALTDMEQRGSVKRDENNHGVELWSAVKRK